MDNQYLEKIKIGARVSILNSQKKNIVGIVEDVALRKPFDEEGIMVRLTNGGVGRVKKIILSEPEINDKIASEIKKFLEKGESFSVEFKAEAFWSISYNPIQIKESKSFEIKEYGQRASKIIIARAIASFLNSEGGNLIIGVKEKKDIDIPSNLITLQSGISNRHSRTKDIDNSENYFTNSSEFSKGQFPKQHNTIKEIVHSTINGNVYNGKFEIVGIEEDMKKLKEPGIDNYKRTIIDEIVRAFFPPKIFNHLNDFLIFELCNIEGKDILWVKIKKSDSRVFLKINNKDLFMIRVDSENRSLEGEKLVDYCIKKWGNR